MATFLVAHGAWSAGWAWKKMRPLLRERGHELFTPTYTGVGERVHLANPEIGLSTHISDVLSVLEFEDLHDVTLIGHSYGGMVATGVADRAPQRFAERARSEPGWRYFELDASHSPHVTAPLALARLLDRIVT